MTWQVGDTIPLSVLVKDGGVPTDPDRIVCRINRPDDSVVSPTPLRVDAGRYVVEYVADIEGNYGVAWTSQNPATAWRDAFVVTDTERIYPLSLGEVKTLLKIEGGKEDEILSQLIIDVCNVGEQFVGVVFGRCSASATVSGDGTKYVCLPKIPVLAVESVFIDDETVTDFEVDAATGILMRDVGWPRGSQVTVSYRAGYQSQPRHHVVGARTLARWLWREHRGAVRVGTPMDEIAPFGLPHAVTDYWTLTMVTGFA